MVHVHIQHFDAALARRLHYRAHDARPVHVSCQPIRHMSRQLLPPPPHNARSTHRSHWNPNASKKKRVPAGPHSSQGTSIATPSRYSSTYRISVWLCTTKHAGCHRSRCTPGSWCSVKTCTRVVRASENGEPAGGLARNGPVVVVSSNSARLGCGVGRCSVATCVGRDPKLYIRISPPSLSVVTM